MNQPANLGDPVAGDYHTFLVNVLLALVAIHVAAALYHHFIARRRITGSWRGVFMHWVNEWPQLLGGCNWYTYHLVMIEFEDDRIMGAVECTFIILGLGFRARWNYKVTERVAEMQEAISEIQAVHRLLPPVE